MNFWKENWEIKVMAILLAVLLWWVLRMNHSVKAPVFLPSEAHRNG
jgi:YbbR domain-containing protein